MSSVNRIDLLYKKFSAASGNKHIASEYALVKLQELIGKFNIQNVLEVGLGIGSIAGTLLELNKKIRYSGTENNNFCLQALPVNLASNYDRLKIYPDLATIPVKEIYELIIIDGKDPNLLFLKKLLSKRGIIILEGDRLHQQKVLQNLFPRHKMVHSISLRKNQRYSPFSPEDWQGGLKIIFANPSALQYVWWLKEKVQAKIKYQYPGRHFGTSGT